MKRLKPAAAVIFAFVLCASFASHASAAVTYDWITTGSIPSGTVSDSDLFSITASWTLADAAVERGRIQLTGYDGYPYPYGSDFFAHPEEIIDFSLTATSLDGSKIYTFDKFDTGINFNLSLPQQEAYRSNLRIDENGPVADLRLMSADGLAQFWLYNSAEVMVSSGDSSYTVDGHWEQRVEVSEPSPLILLMSGIIGVRLNKRFKTQR